MAVKWYLVLSNHRQHDWHGMLPQDTTQRGKWMSIVSVPDDYRCRRLGAGIHFNSKRDMKLTLTEMFTVVTATEASVSFSMVYNKLRPQKGVQA